MIGRGKDTVYRKLGLSRRIVPNGTISGTQIETQDIPPLIHESRILSASFSLPEMPSLRKLIGLGMEVSHHTAYFMIQERNIRPHCDENRSVHSFKSRGSRIV